MISTATYKVMGLYTCISATVVVACKKDVGGMGLCTFKFLPYAILALLARVLYLGLVSVIGT